MAKTQNNTFSPAVEAWEARGEYRELSGQQIFTLDLPPLGEAKYEPLLILHGSLTSSFDYHSLVDQLRRHRRVLLLDLLGHGLSAKPDLSYTIGVHADIIAAFIDSLQIRRLSLLTHDMSNTVGGELLARQMEGRWTVEVTRRVITNGSIYIEMAHLTEGQQRLLSLPDERLSVGLLDQASMRAFFARAFSPASRVDPQELSVIVALIFHHDGDLLLPRLLRFIEERQRSQSRFTGAIEAHPAPLTIVWGTDDPIAVTAMASRLHEARSQSNLTLLEGVGHFPMIEASEQFLAVVSHALEEGATYCL
jgi:pimeloyl-ACP methyl ester carboxylesterase